MNKNADNIVFNFICFSMCKYWQWCS